MFSKEYSAEIKRHYEERQAIWRAAWEERAAQPSTLGALQSRLLDEKLAEADAALANASPDEAEALLFLYGAMSLADFVDVPASIYLAYARHAVFLWQEGPFAGRVPERIFTNYVLHHRVNNEDIADVRGVFYDRLKTVASGGKTMEQTTLDINYWCAEEGTYRSTDGRTQSPVTMLRTAIGRCGEESTFAATALRSVGIPARQVYAPWWSHCDDNHAWVEVWCDGEWHFFGACEPEEALDRGWFVGPASRAMMVHSRWFSLEEPDGERAGTKGVVTLLNQLPRYADTARVTVHVQDESGVPVEGARVRFCVPNESAAGTIAVIRTDAAGKVSLLTGRGDICAAVSADGGRFAEAWLHVGEDAEAHLTVSAAAPLRTDWHDIDFHAPALGRHEAVLSEEQQTAGAEKLRAAAEKRQAKNDSLTNEQTLLRALERFAGAARDEAEKLLRGARGNEAELLRFLEWDASGFVPAGWLDDSAWKLALLKTLREKDTWDITADVLIDAAQNALPFAGTVPDDIFFPYLACPRVMNEYLRPERAFLAGCLDEDMRRAVQKDPSRLLREKDTWFAPEGALGYERTFTSARGALCGGLADEASQNIFCVDLYRALGIPARISPLSGAPEYYDGTGFTAPGRGVSRDACLTVRTEGALKLTDWSHYSIERFENGAFEHVWLWLYLREESAPETLTLTLAPGLYRATTSNRLPSGDQLLRQTTFELAEREEKTLTLALRDIAPERLIKRVPITETRLRALIGAAEGGEKTLSELAGERRALVVWLAVTREPTEHILNELYELHEEYAKLETPLYAVVRGPEDLNDPTLARTRAVLPNLQMLVSTDDAARDGIAALVGQEAGKLPLALIVEKGPACLYSESGYRVGLADMLLKILKA